MHWLKEKWKGVGIEEDWLLLSLLGVGVIFASLVISEWRKEWSWETLLWLGGLLLAYRKRESAKRMFKQEQYLKLVGLLAHNDKTSQLAGVRGLSEFLGPNLEEEKGIAKEARISLETFLRDNFNRRIFLQESRLRSKYLSIRDDIIKALCCACRKKDDNLNLSFLFLANANLSGVDLSYADLSHARLIGADLSHASLIGADLSHASLIGGDLSHASLIGGDLSHAFLKDANLSDVDFSEVKGLEKIQSFDGIWAYRGIEPKWLPNNLRLEVEKNMKDPEEPS